jgi:hypothetical protein
MRLVRILIGVLILYAGLVALFEATLGYTQPQTDTTIVLTTTDDAGAQHDRVVTLLESDGKNYIAVNHWPRAWWGRTKSHPEVEVVRGGETTSYMAAQVSGDEHDRVQADNPIPPVMRFLMGYAPRFFVRLDSMEPAGET